MEMRRSSIARTILGFLLLPALLAVAPPTHLAAANCRVQRCIALTFDDGPDRALTPQILAALEARHAVATFFVVGSRVAPNADILRRAVRDGDEIGNHTWNHPDLTRLSAANVRSQIGQTQQAVVAATGIAPRVFRPPYGATNASVAANAGLRQVLWSYDTADWTDPGVGTVIERAVAGARPGGIILMHDIHRGTAQAAGTIVDRLAAQGYTFVTVSQLG